MGMLFSLMGVGFLGSMVAVPVMVEQQDRAMRVYHEQEIETRDQIEKAVEEIRDLMGQTSPQSIDGFDGNAVTVLHRDAWENELRFDERKDGFAVRSAGKDAEFDTADDIVQAFVDTDVNTRRRHEVSL